MRRIAEILARSAVVVLFSLVACAAGEQSTIGLEGSLEPFIVSTRPLSGDVGCTAEEGVNAESKLKVEQGSVTCQTNLAFAFSEEGTEVCVNKAYVSYLNSFLQMTAGKNRLPYGFAYGWNPSDIANPTKSVLYRSDSRRGSDAGVYQASASLFGTIGSCAFELSSSVLPAVDAKDAHGVFSLKASLWSIELGGITGLQYGSPSVLAGNYRFPIPFVGSITNYGEAQVKDLDSGSMKWLLGLQYEPSARFIPGLVILQLEYYRNEGGVGDMAERWASSTEIPVLGDVLVNYGYAGIIYSDSRASVSFGFMRNLDSDGSGMVNGLIDYHVVRDQTLELSGYYVVSEGDDREFSVLTNSAFEVTLSYKVRFSVSSVEGQKEQ